MKRNLRPLIAIVIVAIAVFYAWSFFRAPSGRRVTEGSRTLYTGFVAIEPVSLDALRELLDTNGCRGENIENPSECWYSYVKEVPAGEKRSMEIFPHGLGWGPLSFAVTEDNRLLATKDIPGPPDIEKYKAAVRKDIADAKLGILVITEGTWKLTKTTYPWDVMY